MKKLRQLKSFFIDFYKYLKTKAFEGSEKAFEEERKKVFKKLRKRYAEIHSYNQKYNVFVYDTVFYPPDSPSQSKRNK